MPRSEPDFISSGLYAAWTVSRGISARQGLALYRAAGGHIGNDRWYKIVAAIRSESEQRTLNLGHDINTTPSHIVPTRWTGSAKRGYFQQVDVVVQDSITGEIRVRTFTGFGRNLRTPKEVIAEALAHFQAGIGSGDYEERILAAAYTGTYSVGI